MSDYIVEAEDDRWHFTREPVRGHLFVGAITDEMIEAGANALCDRQGSYDGDPTEDQFRDAEAVLRAALSSALPKKQNQMEDNHD